MECKKRLSGTDLSIVDTTVVFDVVMTLLFYEED